MKRRSLKALSLVLALFTLALLCACGAEKKPEQVQLSIFSAGDSVLAEKIRNLDLMNITPSRAIAILEELPETARKRI